MIQTIALYDFSHGINLAFHGAGPEQAGDIVIQQLAALRSSVGQNGRVVLCLDSKPYRRTKLFDGYKAGRKSDPELANLWDRTLVRVRNEGYAAARGAGEEADDVMATLALAYQGLCNDVRLVTADKDIAQCVNERCRWLVPQLGARDEFEVRDEQWVRDRFGDVDWVKEKKTGPEPRDIALVLAICGDTSDKIPGVKGIGIKGAVGLVNTFRTIEGMSKGLQSAKDDASVQGKPLSAFWRNLDAGISGIPRWLELTTLRTDVALEREPLAYLERVAPKPLVAESPLPAAEYGEEDLERAAIQAEFEADGGDGHIQEQLSHKELEEERRLMAEALPVGTAAPLPIQPHDKPVLRAEMSALADRVMPLPSTTSVVGKAIVGQMVIGKDPKADETLRQVAQERASSSSTGARADSQSPTQAAPLSGGSAPSPKAAPHPAPAAGSDGTDPAPAAHVVSSSRGPAKEPAALAVAAPNWSLAVQPKSVDGMMWMAEKLYNARVFSAFGSVEGTFGIISFGRELGMGVMQSLTSFCEVKGKPFMWAHAMRARVLASPVCEYLINTECSAEASTWVTRRRGWPEGMTSSYRFTYAEAVQIGLTTGGNRENWTKNPRSLVDKTASSRLIRQVYADVLWGIHCPEETE